jgi:hypothetical protein
MGWSEATTILPVPRENAKSGSGHAISAQNRKTRVTEVAQAQSKVRLIVRRMMVHLPYRCRRILSNAPHIQRDQSAH